MICIYKLTNNNQKDRFIKSANHTIKYCTLTLRLDNPDINAGRILAEKIVVLLALIRSRVCRRDRLDRQRRLPGRVAVGAVSLGRRDFPGVWLQTDTMSLPDDRIVAETDDLQC